jgi:hypothetical protein
VSFRDMLKEVGFFGAFLVSLLIVSELTNVAQKFGVQLGSDATAASFTAPLVGLVELSSHQMVNLGVSAAIALLVGLYTLSLGRPIFVFLMLIMIPLAITELGTDSWISDLMGGEMAKLGLPGTSVLIYTSFIMLCLRLFVAGPLVHALTPLGLLAVSSVIAAAGLFGLSLATGGLLILGVATLYGFGKTFFWPTMLGVVAEQFPKGGALTLNAIAGLGMLAVGILGNPLLGNVQDKEIDRALKADQPALHASVMGASKPSLFGEYRPLDDAKLATASDADRKTVADTKEAAKKNALKTVALFPVVMLAGYLLLILYFAARGGYKPVHIDGVEPGGHH